MPFNVLSLIAFVLGVVVLPLIFSKFIYPDLIKKKPAFAAIAAAFFVLIGFIAAFFVFSASLSMAMVAFGSLLLLPFIIKILEPNTEYELPKGKPRRLSDIFKTHNRLIVFYIFLFFGMALEYMLLFAVLPPALSDSAFSNQMALIGPVAQFGLPDAFATILGNNLMILIIAFALSVFFGAGSIFVLNYNASIAGVLYGSAFRTLIWGTAPFTANLLFFIPHTILEILAYLLAAVGGGILVRGLTKENIRDSAVLFVISLMVLILAAWVEVQVPV
jgi:uncharacterized membrane protein SpoIIM required for sporulation